MSMRRAVAAVGDRVLGVDQDVQERLLQEQPDRTTTGGSFSPCLRTILMSACAQVRLAAGERARQDAIDLQPAAARSGAIR